MDLEATSDSGGGYNLGWTSADLWFKYTANVATAGAYTLNLTVAARSAVTGALHLVNASGVNLTGAVSLPASGGWQIGTTASAHVTLPAGTQTLTLYQDTGGWNLNSLQFTSGSTSTDLAAGESAHNDSEVRVTSSWARHFAPAAQPRSQPPSNRRNRAQWKTRTATRPAMNLACRKLRRPRLRR